MRLGWKQNYEIGIPTIDEQHKGLLQLINDLLSHENLPHTKKEIVKYSELHFATEERFMTITKFPILTQHQLQHESFLKQIILFAEQLESGNTQVFTNLLQFLKNWYITHIGGTDRDYKDYFLAHRNELLKVKHNEKE